LVQYFSTKIIENSKNKTFYTKNTSITELIFSRKGISILNRVIECGSTENRRELQRMHIIDVSEILQRSNERETEASPHHYLKVTFPSSRNAMQEAQLAAKRHLRDFLACSFHLFKSPRQSPRH